MQAIQNSLRENVNGLTDLIETGTSVSNKHPIKQIKKTGAKHGRPNSVIIVVYRRDDTS